MFQLFNFLIVFIVTLAILTSTFISKGPQDGLAFVGVAVLACIYFLATLLPCLGVSIRRLHDRDLSGWWFLISLIPYVGGIIFLILAVMDGTKGPNRFGPDPKQQ